MHDSEPVRIANPSPYETFIHNTLPVFTGAPKFETNSMIKKRKIPNELIFGCRVLDFGFDYCVRFESFDDDPAVEKLRNRQVKNFLAVTMLSAGMPMILMGDEARRTQRGNNNAYCQDNETSWFDWALLAKHADVHRFMTLLNARRLLRDLEPEGQRVSLSRLLRGANLAWHGVNLG
jgi:hypothetical protein